MFGVENRGSLPFVRVAQVRVLIFALTFFRIRTSTSPLLQALYILYLQVSPTSGAIKEVASTY
jgi:hypothetical protein